MQKGSRVIVALSLLISVIAGLVSGASQFSSARAETGACLASQASWDSEKATVASVRASGKKPWEMTNDQLIAMYRAENEIPIPRPVCIPANPWMFVSKGIFAALGAFIVTFIVFHIAWLVGRAYNKVMSKLS